MNLPPSDVRDDVPINWATPAREVLSFDINLQSCTLACGLWNVPSLFQKELGLFSMSSFCTAIMISQKVATCHIYWICRFSYFSWLRWIDSFITFLSLILEFSVLQPNFVLICSVFWSLLANNTETDYKASNNYYSSQHLETCLKYAKLEEPPIFTFSQHLHLHSVPRGVKFWIFFPSTWYISLSLPL